VNDRRIAVIDSTETAVRLSIGNVTTAAIRQKKSPGVMLEDFAPRLLTIS